MAKEHFKLQQWEECITFTRETLLPSCEGYLNIGAASVQEVIKQIQDTLISKAPRVTVKQTYMLFTKSEATAQAWQTKADKAVANLGPAALRRALAKWEHDGCVHAEDNAAAE